MGEHWRWPVRTRLLVVVDTGAGRVHATESSTENEVEGLLRLRSGLERVVRPSLNRDESQRYQYCHRRNFHPTYSLTNKHTFMTYHTNRRRPRNTENMLTSIIMGHAATRSITKDEYARICCSPASCARRLIRETSITRINKGRLAAHAAGR